MANDIVQNSRDWLSSPRTHASVWGDPESGHRCGAFHSSACANRGVDRRPRLDEYCVHPQFKAMRTDPLPLYGPLLSRDDRAGAHVCFGYHFRQLLCMAYIGGSHSWRKYDRLVGHRKGRGENSRRAVDASASCTIATGNGRSDRRRARSNSEIPPSCRPWWERHRHAMRGLRIWWTKRRL